MGRAARVLPVVIRGRGSDPINGDARLAFFAARDLGAVNVRLGQLDLETAVGVGVGLRVKRDVLAAEVERDLRALRHFRVTRPEGHGEAVGVFL